MWPWFSCPGGTTEGLAGSPTSAAAAEKAGTGSGSGSGSGSGGLSAAADSKRTEGFRRENARLREANTRLLSRVRSLEDEVGHLRRDVHDRERDALRARAAAAAAAAPAAAQCAGVAAVLPALAQLEKTVLEREEGLARCELSDALARGAVQAAAAAAATAAADGDADGDVEGDTDNVDETSPETEEVLCCDSLGPSPVEEGAAVGSVLLNKGVPATVVPPLGATEKSYCVVFDVDETQVHFAVETMPEPKAELRFRRGVDLALKRLSRLKAEGLELGLWTAGVPRYAVAVRGLLGMLAGWQESEVFDWTIARDPSWVSNGVRKDLSTLNRDLRRVLLVENSRKVVVQKENTLIVTNFYSTAKGAVRDHTLNTVASLVEEMVRSDPPVAVPDFLKQKAAEGALHCQNGFYHVPTSRTR